MSLKYDLYSTVNFWKIIISLRVALKNTLASKWANGGRLEYWRIEAVLACGNLSSVCGEE